MSLFLSRWAAALFICLALCACSAPAPASGGNARSSHGAEDQFEGKALQLAIAAEHGQTETIRRLMREDKVDPDAIFAREAGMPLVAWPVYTRNPKGLKALLENGADPNARRPEFVDKQYDDGSGGRYYRHENAMVYAAQEENPIYLQLLLDHGGDPNTRNGNNEPLTFVAFIKQNQWQNVKLLIERGAAVNDPSIFPGAPLSWYASRGGFEQVYWLLQHGADPTKKITGTMSAPKDANGTPLPQKHIPEKGYAWVLYGEDGKPVYVETMPIIEEIYWHPGSPETVEWQRRCQHWLRDKGIPRPPMPEAIREMRKAFKFPYEEKHIPLL